MKSDARLLFLTKYGRLGPSSRYRVFQYIPYLEQQGYRCDVQCLHAEDYFESFFARERKSPLYHLERISKRLAAAAGAFRYSAVFVQKEIVPYLPPLPELMLKGMRVKVIYDFDDAIFLAYDVSMNPLVRAVLGPKIPAALRWSSVVLAGNAYLKEYASAHNPRTILFPTVVDHRKYEPKARSASGERAPVAEPALPVIGWIGTPETACYLVERSELLRKIAARFQFQLRVIGAPGVAIPGVAVRSVPWDEKTEAAELLACDIGIMPLPANEWVKGKCGLKLLQYMACGLPVVSSPDGGTDMIVAPGVNGFIARSDAEWLGHVGSLLNDPRLRMRMGAEGRRRIEQQFSLTVWQPRMAEVIGRCIRGECLEALQW